MNKYLIVVLLSASSVFGQPNREGGKQFFPFISPFQAENIVIRSAENDFNFFYVYKIAYNHLVFERDNSKYKAALRVLVEIMDSTGKIFQRDIRDTKIEVNTFETTSDRSLFLEDFLSFKLLSGNYFINTSVTDLNSLKEIKPEPVVLELDADKSGLVLQPLIIETGDFDCSSEKSYKLANVGGSIPFSPLDFHLIIPVADTSVSNISVLIFNDRDTLLEQQSNESYILPLKVSKCSDNLVIESGVNSKPTKNFVIRNVNRNLWEGEIKLVVFLSDTLSEQFNSRVIWLDKPFSFMNPEAAIELLRFIEADSVVVRMLNEDESEYLKILYDYWKSFDPTPETSFNQLMAEYYRRIDFAIKEFRGLGKTDGTKSDRGMIYIRFGKPETVERSSNNQGQVVETWYYKNPERKFIFVDQKGTGNFTLIEN